LISAWQVDAVALEGQTPIAILPKGIHTISLTVDDGRGGLATDSKVVTVVDQTPPTFTMIPGPFTVEETSSAGTPLFVPPASATDNCGPITMSSNAPAVFPHGTTKVTFTATDASGNSSTATTTVNVVDTTPPTFTAASATPSAIWPPNHKMVPVVIKAAAVDICDPIPAVRIISITSNEPSGHTDPDWEITGPLTLNLRAERSGAGEGRIYTITLQAIDASGNSSIKKVTVSVAHDQGGK
jgi:hypothetical protein